MPEAPPITSATAAQTGTTTQTGAAPWPQWLLVVFRFSFCYFLLYTLPTDRRFWYFGPLGAIPGTRFLGAASTGFWQLVNNWAAAHVFRMSTDGDGLAVLEVYILLSLAGAGALVWGVLDRKRTEYSTLHAWLRLWLRYCLAFTLIFYGMRKVFPLQMQLNPGLLVRRWGDFSPFEVLWTFMSASKPYQIFSGVMEVSAALLLLFRRTTPLGAAISLAVMTNVTALDFCYDIDPKVFALHLTLISACLLAPELPRLVGVFMVNRGHPPADLSRPVFPRGWMRVTARLVWIYAVGSVLYLSVSSAWRSYKRRFIDPQPALYGLYEVDAFIRNSNAVPPLVGDDTRWRWLYVRWSNSVVTIDMHDNWHFYNAQQGKATNSITLFKDADTNLFTYSWNDTNHLVLRGTASNDTLEVRLHKLDLNSFKALGHDHH